jgi:hypothetical protein
MWEGVGVEIRLGLAMWVRGWDSTSLCANSIFNVACNREESRVDRQK